MIGMEMLKPKTFVAMLIWDTSISTRGRNLKSGIILCNEMMCSLIDKTKTNCNMIVLSDACIMMSFIFCESC